MDQNVCCRVWDGKSWHLQVGRAHLQIQPFNSSASLVASSPSFLQLSLIMSDYGGDDDAGIK
jgi:hypothetical protein